MTQHEKLKRICDEIWHAPEFEYWDLDWDWFDDYFWEYNRWTWLHRMVDVREIIFNPEFMGKLKIELYQKFKTTFQVNLKLEKLLNNLHDPVWFLDNLLFNE